MAKLDALNNIGKFMTFPIMSIEDHAAVFGAVPVLNGLNKKLLSDFDHRVRGEVNTLDFSNGALASEEPLDAGGEGRWAKVRVGDILLAVLPMFKLYTDYSDRYEEARELVSELSGEENKTEFARSLKEGVAAYSAGADLQSLLIEPIQRIPRYPMLIERLLELTSDKHPDKEDLAAAFKLSLEIATEINVSLKRHQEQLELLRLSKCFWPKTDLVKPGRWFVKKGSLTKLSDTYARRGNAKSAEKGQIYDVWLFNDSIAFGTGPYMGYYRLQRFMMLQVRSAIRRKGWQLGPRVGQRGRRNEVGVVRERAADLARNST